MAKGVDRRDAAAAVRLGQFLTEELDNRGLQKNHLAKHLRLHPSNVTRMLNGTATTLAEALRTVAETERFIGLDHGAMRIVLGLPPEGPSAPAAIATDKHLTEESKGALRRLYGYYYGRTRGSSPSIPAVEGSGSLRRAASSGDPPFDPETTEALDEAAEVEINSDGEHPDA